MRERGVSLSSIVGITPYISTHKNTVARIRLAPCIITPPCHDATFSYLSCFLLQPASPIFNKNASSYESPLRSVNITLRLTLMSKSRKDSNSAKAIPTTLPFTNHTPLLDPYNGYCPITGLPCNRCNRRAKLTLTNPLSKHYQSMNLVITLIV